MSSAPTPQPLVLVEDDDEIRQLVSAMLTREGFQVTALPRGEELLPTLRSTGAPLVILDLMLPGVDGLTLCRQVRSHLPDVAILMLTAKSDDIDRIIGLEMGADDYLTKPFNPRELLARVRAILRRASRPAEAGTPRLLSCAGFLVNLAARAVSRAGEDVALTSLEFDLLASFVAAPQAVLSRDQLSLATRGHPADPLDRGIDMAVSRLRRKLTAEGAPESLIRTVRNAGYMLTVPVEAVGEGV